MRRIKRKTPKYIYAFIFTLVFLFACILSICIGRYAFLFYECMQTVCPTQSALSYNVLIYTLAAGNEYNISSIVGNRQRYAQHWNISFVVETSLYPSPLLPPWHKIFAYFNYKNKYDYIWFLDADAMIMNKSCSIHGIIERFNKGGIIIAEEYSLESLFTPRLTSGSFVAKTNLWSNKFFKNVLKLSSNKNVYNIDYHWEQAAINHLAQTTYIDDKHISIIKGQNAYLDSFVNVFSGRPYRSGDFVLHSAGLGYQWLHRWINMFDLQIV